MKYQEWISMASEEMMSLPPEEIVGILAELPKGFAEPDEAKAAKLADVHTLSTISAIINDVNRDSGKFKSFSDLSSSIQDMFLNNSHGQTFVHGQDSIRYNLHQYLEKIRNIREKS